MEISHDSFGTHAIRTCRSQVCRSIPPGHTITRLDQRRLAGRPRSGRCHALYGWVKCRTMDVSK